MDAKLQIGEEAPDFSLEDEAGKVHKLSEFRGQRVILYFYPKDDTPGCTTQACGFRDRSVEINAKHAVVLGVSPDSKESHVRFKSKYNLPFHLLADTDHAVATKYGVWGQKSFAGKKYAGIYRSHFLIDENGKIAGSEISVKPETSIKLAVEWLA